MGIEFKKGDYVKVINANHLKLNGVVGVVVYIQEREFDCPLITFETPFYRSKSGKDTLTLASNKLDHATALDAMQIRKAEHEL
jgi:hypothetical protein